MKRHALFVGINDYADNAFKNLRYSVSDAAALSGAFSARGFDTSVLTNPRADEITGAVERAADGLGPGDVFLFFFAGHGFTAPDGSHLLICANDKLSFLRHNRAGIPVGLLEEVTNGSGFHRAFLLDACRTDVFAGVENRGAETRDLALVSLPDAKANAGTCCVLRSCDRFCPAMEFDDLGHGVFTRAVMDALSDDSACAIPFGETFVSGIRSRMRGILAAHGVPADQNPCFQTNGEAFMLFDTVANVSETTTAQPYRPTTAPALETDVLRRKLSLSRALKSVSAADRTDKEFSTFIATAEDEMAVAEKAIRLDKFPAAAESLDRVESALDDLRKARFEREMAERKAKEEADRVAREKAEAERKAREEVERIAREKVEPELEAWEEIMRGARRGCHAWGTGGSGTQNGAGRYNTEINSVVAALSRDKVQLWRGGPYWATTNIGAEEPWEYGLYFWWGDTIGYRYENDAWVASDGSSSDFSFDDRHTPTKDLGIATLKNEGWIAAGNVLAPRHDPAQTQWGLGWRMPTTRELEGLVRKCSWTQARMNGVFGNVVRGRDDFSDASIFIPCAGRVIYTSLRDAGDIGCYWSSVPYSVGNYTNYSRHLQFSWDGFGAFTHNEFRDFGFSVRPVQGFSK